ncbi:hypothetical protein STRTUCAR8_08624 [Streptomyces turgidiscabies Car8]|uniref:Uncharacterized protein n=1 Tax=Streptomyces turgidiscabies (strain Car8) TaxID=698760 RepID=L7F7R1_STRT8|nr:hypothetical protein [Streptomyces turgidiscabies]ELP67618.1 hypothetical protein STRTUCAR8_08624 [Streptomyces turgidiscabies Car8]
MTPDQAIWVRENVWPPIWLRKHTELKEPFLHCACQRPPSLPCQAGRHGACLLGEFPVNETVIQNSRLFPATFPEPYAHRTPEDRHTFRLMHGRNVLAWVWLSGKPCRQRCTCGCHRKAPEVSTTVVAEAVQLDLFAGVAG